LHFPCDNLAVRVRHVDIDVGVRVLPPKFDDLASQRDRLVAVVSRRERMMRLERRACGQEYTEKDCCEREVYAHVASSIFRSPDRRQNDPDATRYRLKNAIALGHASSVAAVFRPRS